jgi:chromosome segregation ATPase
MNQLRLEADESSAKVEELQSKVKALEQENLTKEQEITSLQHRNNLLESQVEKLETGIKDLKKSADEGQQHGTENESLTRRLQLLEEEAETADKTLREANDKYVATAAFDLRLGLKQYQKRENMALLTRCCFCVGSARLTSRLVTSSEKCRLSKSSESNGRPNMRRWRRSTTRCRRSWRNSKQRLAISERTCGSWLLEASQRHLHAWTDEPLDLGVNVSGPILIMRLMQSLAGRARCLSHIEIRSRHIQNVHI